MKYLSRRLSHRGLALGLLAAAVAWLAPPNAVHGQKEPTSARLNVAKDLTKPEGRDEFRQLQAMRKGDTPPSKEVLDHAAQWFLYRLTWTEYQDGSVKTLGGLPV